MSARSDIDRATAIGEDALGLLVEEGFRVADWEVVPATNRIRRDGKIVRLEPKVMDLLVYFARHQGELVTRDDMERAVWSGTVVGYDTSTTAIRKLRKALSDDPRHPTVIETLSKRGYRLMAPVSPLRATTAADGDSAPTAARKPSEAPNTGVKPALFIGLALLCLGLLVSVIDGTRETVLPSQATPLKIAVVPFENLSGESAHDGLALGMCDDLSTSLTQVPGLAVIARESMPTAPGSQLDVHRLGDEIGVDVAVHGSILGSDQRIRINVHLVNARTGTHLWAQRYDGQTDRMIRVQGQINRDLVSALARLMSPDDKQRDPASSDAVGSDRHIPP